MRYLKPSSAVNCILPFVILCSYLTYLTKIDMQVYAVVAYIATTGKHAPTHTQARTL